MGRVKVDLQCGRQCGSRTARREQGEDHAWLGKKEVAAGVGAGGLALGASTQSATHLQLLSTAVVFKTRSLVPWSCQSCEEGREVDILHSTSFGVQWGAVAQEWGLIQAGELERLRAEGPGLEQWVG